MTSSLDIHQPIVLVDPTVEELDAQRVYDLVIAQEGIARIFDELAGLPWLNGVLIENITLQGATTTNIPHKLGRKIRGYIICKQNAPTQIYNVDTESVDDTKFIVLRSANTVKFDIVVY